MKILNESIYSILKLELQSQWYKVNLTIFYVLTNLA